MSLLLRCRGRSLSNGIRRLAWLLLAVAGTCAAQSELRTGKQILEEVNARINNVDTAGLQKLAAQRPALVLVDVRMGEELASLRGTIDAGYRTYNINRGWLEFRIRESVPDQNTPIVVFCGINERSPLAADTLMRMGYTEVYNYADGFFAWKDAGLPVTLLDEAPGTMLYRLPVEVADGVWSAIGATAPPSYENSGHNNNLSFIVTWLPGRKLVITGDMAFHERLLPVFEHTDTAAWIESWDAFVALGAETVIPGHGGPTTMKEVTRYTVDYLRYMRAEVAKVIEEDGTLQDVYAVDQSAYSHLDTFDELARLNAGRIYRAMEFE